MNEVKLWTYLPVAEGMEVVALVEEEDGNIRIDLKEPERLLSNVTVRMDKAVARILATAIMAVVTGCASTGGICDGKQLAAETSHTSHVSAGPPIGPKEEEDSLDTIGLVGRCTRGHVYVETGLGYKFREGGFYGPEDIFTIRVGTVLWKSQ